MIPRMLIRLLACPALLAVALTVPAQADIAASGGNPRCPNVVLFLIDDLGWADLGVTGSTFHETPNVDRLASGGAFFTDAYAANPVCSPTRASVLTGKYPSRIHLTNHSGSRGPFGPGHRLTPPELAGNMPLEDTTLAEALKEAGYTTAHIGKWHLQAHHQGGRNHYPEANGFDLNIAGHKMGQPGSYHFPYQSDKHPSTNVPGMKGGKEGDYLTDILTDRAISFIEEHEGKPFFLNLWYYTVHTPIEPRQDKWEKYQKKAQGLGLDKNPPAPVSVRQSFSRPRQDNPAYAAMIESMDENIGRIMDALGRLGLEEDTLVVFLSDNGGLSTGSSPNMPTSNLPLRAGKAWVYEGGIRSPLIIRYPAKIKAGQRLHTPAVSTDIYPTILDLAGLPLRPEQHVDGVSLKPLLTDEADGLDREALYFHFPHYHHINSMGPAGAVRMGDHKLVEVFETGEVELYNLRDDPEEQHDMAEEKPELPARLTKMLHDWRKKSGARMPTPNAAYRETNDWRNK